MAKRIALASILLLLSLDLDARDCNKAYKKKISKLSEAHLTYFQAETKGSVKADLDKDGLEDHIYFTSTRAIKTCEDYEIHNLLDKTNIIRIDYGHGRSWVADFKAPLMKEFTLYPAKGELIAKGVNENGEEWQRTIKYK